MNSTSLTSDESRGQSKRSQEDENLDQKPPAKKPRSKKRSLEAIDSSTELPLDALGLVMEFLSPRQLYNLAFSCKTLRSFITTPLVVKSALIHGGHAKQTLVELHNVMSKKAMHVPSTLRLLRLVNGKRCELCNKNAVNRTRSTFGVFACWDCTTKSLTKPWKLTWARYQRNSARYGDIFKHPRVAFSDYGSINYMWSRPQQQQDGETIGPLVAFGDVDKLFEHITKEKGTVDSYVQLNLLKESDTDEAYQEFNQAYSETWKRSEQIEKERFEKKAANQAKAKENKVAKIDKMIEDLEKLLDEPYRGCTLKYTKLKYVNGTKGISKLPVVQFKFSLADKLLKRFAITPSKIRKKILTEIAQEMNEKLRLITPSFLALEFLSPNDPFELAVRAYLSRKFTDMESFFEMVTEKSECYGCWSQGTLMLDESFFKMLEGGRLISALAHLLQNDFSCLFLSPRNTQNQKALAKTVWYNIWAGRKGDEDQHYRDAYATMTVEWPKARRAFHGFAAWLDSKYTSHKDVHFKRSYVCDKVCNNRSILPLLVAEEFEELEKKFTDEFEAYYWQLMR